MKKQELFNMIMVTMFAGIIDANIFNHNQAMSSPQTGNLVQLGSGIAHGSIETIINSGMILLSFIIGVFIMQKLKNHEAKLYIGLNVLAFLVMQANMGNAVMIVACSVLLGAQLEMYRKVWGVAVNSTIMTGNLRKAVEPFSGQAPYNKFNAYLPLIVIISFLLGAIIGSIEIIVLNLSIVSYSILVNIVIQIITMRKVKGQ